MERKLKIVLPVIGQWVSSPYLFKRLSLYSPVLDWSTLDHHKRFQESDAYKPFYEKAGSFGRLKTMVHVELMPYSPSKALDAPVTEVLLRTLKSPSYRSDLDVTVEALRGLLVKQKGFVGAVWGPTVENPNLFVAFVGWQSVEV